MDIDLLSKMVKELILDNDKVALPGLGCFVAEIVPSTFSDKGYTINPPYRRLSFRSKPDDGDMLVRFYATSNGVNIDVARRIIVDFVKELKAVLHTRKMVVFPGLGRLRATKENNVFFVADENLDIYPSGFGLQPVSLKNHDETKEEVAAAVEGLASILSVDQADVDISEPETVDAQECKVSEEAVVLDEVAASEPIVVESAGCADKMLEGGVLVEAKDPHCEVEPLPVQKLVAPAESQIESESVPAPASASDSVKSTEVLDTPLVKRDMWRKVLITIVISLGLVAVVLLLIMFLGRVAPNFIDKLLYSAEDLEILYYQFK